MYSKVAFKFMMGLFSVSSTHFGIDSFFSESLIKTLKLNDCKTVAALTAEWTGLQRYTAQFIE